MNSTGLPKEILDHPALLVIAVSARAAVGPQASPATNVMPISWKQAYSQDNRFP